MKDDTSVGGDTIIVINDKEQFGTEQGIDTLEKWELFKINNKNITIKFIEEDDEFSGKESEKKKQKFPKAGDAIFTNPDISSTPEKLLQNHGYYSETHEVESEDGYITTLFRIPYGKGHNPQLKTSPPQAKSHQRPTVLFVHGIITNGISWVLNSDENILAYQLANQGFDVWLLNARGTEFSKKHKTMSCTSRKFWEFSWDEMGKYDIPQVINYILQMVGQQQLFYVGHSMGCTMLFVAAHYHPEITPKIKLMIAYAPAIFLSHSRTPFVKLAARFPCWTTLLKLYHGEIYCKPIAKMMKTFAPWLWIWGERIARDSTWAMWKGIGPVNGCDNEQLYWPMMPVIASHLPSPTSLRAYEHFLQGHKSGKFQQFDFGRAKNLKKYGEPKPPQYDLKKVTFPVGIFYGDNDACIPPEDIETLSKELPNLQVLHRVDWPYFNHVGFIFAKDANQLVNSHVLELIRKHM